LTSIAFLASFIFLWLTPPEQLKEEGSKDEEPETTFIEDMKATFKLLTDKKML